MKFKVDLGADNADAVIQATPTELDGFPLIEKLIISKNLFNLSPDRCVAASVLAFAPYLSGQQIFPNQFSSLTAELSQRLLQPGWTHFSPLHPANLPLPRGSREVALRIGEEKPSAVTELRLIPQNGDSGVRYEPSSIVVKTNAIDLDILAANSPIHPARACLATALLLAEDLDVGTFIISKETCAKFKLNNAVTELLNAVSIGLRVEDE